MANISGLLVHEGREFVKRCNEQNVFQDQIKNRTTKQLKETSQKIHDAIITQGWISLACGIIGLAMPVAGATLQATWLNNMSTLMPSLSTGGSQFPRGKEVEGNHEQQRQSEQLQGPGKIKEASKRFLDEFWQAFRSAQQTEQDSFRRIFGG